MKLVISTLCVLLLGSCGNRKVDSNTLESHQSKKIIRNIVFIDGWCLRCETTEFASGTHPLREYWFSDKNINLNIINTRQAELTRFFMLSDSLLMFRAASCNSQGQNNLYVFNLKNHKLKSLGNLEFPNSDIAACLNFKKECVYTIDSATNNIVACNWNSGEQVVLNRLHGVYEEYEQRLYQRNDSIVVQSFKRKIDTLSFYQEVVFPN